MPTSRRRWNARMTYEIDGFPVAEFSGRKPQTIADGAHRVALLSLGVFRDVGGNQLSYTGRAYWLGRSGRRYAVDEAGLIAIDFSDVDIPRQRLEEEMEAVD